MTFIEEIDKEHMFEELIVKGICYSLVKPVKFPMWNTFDFCGAR